MKFETDGAERFAKALSASELAMLDKLADHAIANGPGTRLTNELALAKSGFMRQQLRMPPKRLRRRPVAVFCKSTTRMRLCHGISYGSASDPCPANTLRK